MVNLGGNNMEQKLIDEYSKLFDAYCTTCKRKSTINQEQKAIVWRMVYIISKVAWGFDNPGFNDIDEVFKELKFPYNEKVLSRFIDNCYEYEIPEEDIDNFLKNLDESSQKKEKELQLEFNSYISYFENKEDIEWFKDYCQSRDLQCSLDNNVIASLVDNYFFDWVKTYGYPKRKEFELMDEIFMIITFPKDIEAYKKFVKESDQDEILEKIDKL